MKVFDGHSDIWTDVTVRRLKGEDHILERYHLDRLRQGEIEGAIFVIWSDPPYDADPVTRTAEIQQCILDETAECDQVVLCKNIAEIQQAIADGKFYILLGVEGLSMVGDNLEVIDALYAFGARHCSLTWNEENTIATGVCGEESRGLTPFGESAVKRILSKKMLLDVSHLNEKSFWDVMNLATKPIIASHSNAKALCNVPRNLTDQQLLAIRDTGGIVGANAFKPFIHNDPTRHHVKDLVAQIAYIADKIGVEHTGFGFDFTEFLCQDTMDAFSSTDVPYVDGLEDASHVPTLLAEMKLAGFEEDEIQQIAGGNYHRLIEKVL